MCPTHQGKKKTTSTTSLHVGSVHSHIHQTFTHFYLKYTPGPSLLAKAYYFVPPSRSSNLLHRSVLNPHRNTFLLLGAFSHHFLPYYLSDN